MESALRTIRIVWIGMFIAGLIYVWLPERLGVQPREANPLLYTLILVQAVAVFVIAVGMRKFMVGKATETLRTNVAEAVALQKWRTGQIVSVAMFESIVLFGLVLRFTGATRMQVAPLYVLGLGAMIVFWPREIQ
jgi:hypothetical protein